MTDLHDYRRAKLARYEVEKAAGRRAVRDRLGNDGGYSTFIGSAANAAKLADEAPDWTRLEDLKRRAAQVRASTAAKDAKRQLRQVEASLRLLQHDGVSAVLDRVSAICDSLAQGRNTD